MQSNKETIIHYISQNRSRFYRIARMYANTDDEAFDIVSDAVLKALVSIDNHTGIDYMKSWFYRVIVSCAIDYIRKNKKYMLTDEPSAYNHIEKSCHEDEIAEKMVLKKCLDCLKPKYKTVIILRYYEDLQYNEIAKILQCPESTVKSRVRKALSLLKEEIDANE